MNKKGFTLIELLAVIVILGIIMIIAGTSVIGTIRETEKKTKFMAAKEIIEMAKAYIEAENKTSDTISVKDMCDAGYIEKDATNPATGKNIKHCSDFGSQQIIVNTESEQKNYDLNNGRYQFDGYIYKLN